MDKISIKNIFSSNINNAPLDVISMFNVQNKNNLDNQEVNFEINDLHIRRDNKRKKLFQEYEKILLRCFKKIKVANEYNKSEFVFGVPPLLIGFNDYDAQECLFYVFQKISEKKIKCKIITETHLLIKLF